MDYTGDIKRSVPTPFATFSVVEEATKLVVTVTVSGNVEIIFPLTKGIDQNEIGIRISNVINQTGFIDGEVDIIFD